MDSRLTNPCQNRNSGSNSIQDTLCLDNPKQLCHYHGHCHPVDKDLYQYIYCDFSIVGNQHVHNINYTRSLHRASQLGFHCSTYNIHRDSMASLVSDLCVTLDD